MAIKIKNPFRTNAKKVTKAATDAEFARGKRYEQTATRINQIFDDPMREDQRSQFAAALRQQYGDELNRGYTQNARQSKFSVARRGMTGGSVDVDAQRRLAEALQRGKLAAESNVQDAVAGLRDQDENMRFAMLDTARGGASAGEAATRSAALMQSGGSNFAPRALGDAFGSFAETLRQNTARNAYQRGLDAGIWG